MIDLMSFLIEALIRHQFRQSKFQVFGPLSENVGNFFLAWGARACGPCSCQRFNRDANFALNQRYRFRNRMGFHIESTLRFWVEVEYQSLLEENPDRSKPQLLSDVLRGYEAAGDAMRYLDRKGRVAWKATPRMLTRLADAEREVEDDWADWP
jgi:hypothetical protein